MKKLNLLDKLIYILNSIFAAVLLLAYVLPYVPPKTFSALSVLSLSVPVLIVCNALFVLYWLLKVKKQLLLSLLVLVIGYSNVGTLYKFSSAKQTEGVVNSLSVMSYNVRLFNLYNWLDNGNVGGEVSNLVKKEKPDVIAFQEYRPDESVKFSYPFQYESLLGNKNQYGQAIMSKYPIANKGVISFNNSSNKAIYVDIVKKNDTIRIYNVHFESLHINPNVQELSESSTESLIKRIGPRFVKQQDQALKIIEHQKNCSYKKIVLGDFNNTAYSYIYKQFKENGYVDAFVEAGNGFGKTFDFKFFPLRIDFILAEERLEITSFKNLSNKYSDHYPIKASFTW
ncbi:endonuclease/exonuclease/phosphatase family protein [Pseudofulvibacter geojedonensis]|uniref:Endonuclease/exonuclease/phosphatase family protein n=1 Tax=Pseudofulvibacter geojedonensis TaxID=1123758 RepID=A0ABW3I339_9FLAO